ncbi:restriction endonuclease subunit S [Vreelandella massiliensis]|uniref:restriction endonuclease subunit S n=1 Tax=Vreelandella massiliensis TaxID=1816686 RepID=UPI00096A8D17|nr:restriction endonuclease subunit S [Halomonas massiliensis]
MSYPAYPEYKDSGVEWLGKVPAHWEVSRLKFFGELITGITPPSEDFSNYSEAGWPWVRPDDLDDQGAPVRASKFLTDQGWSYCRPVDPMSTLVCCIGSIGKLGYTTEVTCTNQQITSIQPYYDARYLFYLTCASKPELDLRATGNVLRILNAERLGNVPAVMPPVDEQATIAAFLDHETARIDALVEEQQRLIELLKEKRQAVISHAVTKGLDPDVPMKDSGVEWLGEVPAHWLRKRLKNVSPFITVGIVVNPSSYLAEEGLPFIYGGEVREGYIEVDKARKISLEDSRRNRKTMLETGDVVTMRVGYPGVTAVVPPECEGGNCASVMLIKKGSYDSRWLCAAMNSRLIRHQVEVVQYGAAQKQFNIADAVEFWLFEPPIDEQTRIADYIDRESSSFDQLVVAAKRNMQLLQERRSALISAAVTGKIDVRGWHSPEISNTHEASQQEAV